MFAVCDPEGRWNVAPGGFRRAGTEPRGIAEVIKSKALNEGGAHSNGELSSLLLNRVMSVYNPLVLPRHLALHSVVPSGRRVFFSRRYAKHVEAMSKRQNRLSSLGTELRDTNHKGSQDEYRVE